MWALTAHVPCHHQHWWRREGWPAKEKFLQVLRFKIWRPSLCQTFVHLLKKKKLGKLKRNYYSGEAFFQMHPSPPPPPPPKIIKVYSGRVEVELWYPKVFEGKELLNAKAMWPSFPGSAETEERGNYNWPCTNVILLGTPPVAALIPGRDWRGGRVIHLDVTFTFRIKCTPLPRNSGFIYRAF